MIRMAIGMVPVVVVIVLVADGDADADVVEYDCDRDGNDGAEQFVCECEIVCAAAS